jgi:hypothetical protein
MHHRFGEICPRSEITVLSAVGICRCMMVSETPVSGQDHERPYFMNGDKAVLEAPEHNSPPAGHGAQRGDALCRCSWFVGHQIRVRAPISTTGRH